VIDTGTWLPGRQVLLPPSSLGRPLGMPRAFPVDLTREKVKESPDISTDAPVSRQREADLYSYYGWVPYWSGPYAYAPVGFGMGAPVGYGPAYPPEGPRGTNPRTGRAESAEEERGDPHLRSANEVTGYYIQAEDGDIGHVEDLLVEDLLVEDESWAVRYLIVDTKNWWPGKKVLVAPQWVRGIDWAREQVAIDLTREQIKAAPEYDPATTVDRTYEERLYGHYDRPRYWA
jgi:hypothetical protein